VRTAVRRGADDAGLEVVTADLTSDAGWAAALDGCAEVCHVASPMIHPANPDEVVVPARDGTVRVLRAARDAGARRVVLTSSFAAVGYTEVRSSLQLTKMMLDGAMPVVRRQRFGVADVRDVADVEILAMAAPEAACLRFLADGPTISFLQMAQILRDLGLLAQR
jgi:nucleoside-diphosphate-sugar epimerase